MHTVSINPHSPVPGSDLVMPILSKNKLPQYYRGDMSCKESLSDMDLVTLGVHFRSPSTAHEQDLDSLFDEME